MTAERDGESRRTAQPDLLASLPEERPAPGIDRAALEELRTAVQDIGEQLAGLREAASGERQARVTPEALEAWGDQLVTRVVEAGRTADAPADDAAAAVAFHTGRIEEAAAKAAAAAAERIDGGLESTADRFAAEFKGMEERLAEDRSTIRATAAGIESAVTRIETGLGKMRDDTSRASGRADRYLEDIRRRTAIPEAEIRAVALGHAPGRYTLAEVDAAIARLVRGGELIEAERRGMDRAFVTDRAVRAERRVLASMRSGCGKGLALAGADAVEARLGASRLTRGQRGAVRTALLSDDLVIGVQGHAGSGKTTMLREVKELLGEQRIQGLAPSAVAARVLAREAGIPSRTLQYFLTRFGDLSDPERLARGRADYAGAVLAVDEASMIDTARMEALLRIARDLGVGRVALVGDTAQLKAVDAGQPFRLLQKAGMATATMDEVLRQRDPELLAAVGLARQGAPGAAIAELGERVAYRVDRLRLCGNGVVPLVAAHAWRTLKARFDGDA